jgi:hypothetical protein
MLQDAHLPGICEARAGRCNPDFAFPAVTAVRQWTFQPGRKGFRPVETHMQVPVEFTLREERGGDAPRQLQSAEPAGAADGR